MARTKTAVADYHPITVRFPLDILTQIRAYADDEDRNVNEQIIHFLKQHLRQINGAVTPARLGTPPAPSPDVPCYTQMSAVSAGIV